MADKPEWIYRQSAAIPYFEADGQLQVVLITANSSKRWIIPKGIVERDMTPAASAAKEALEEAGVEGKISDKKICEYEYQKWGGDCHVQVFPLHVSKVLDEWDEMEVRDRQIVAATEAVAMVKPVLQDVMAKFVEQFA